MIARDTDLKLITRLQFGRFDYRSGQTEGQSFSQLEYTHRKTPK